MKCIRKNCSSTDLEIKEEIVEGIVCKIIKCNKCNYEHLVSMIK